MELTLSSTQTTNSLMLDKPIGGTSVPPPTMKDYTPKNPLPKPGRPYPDWSRFLTAAWEHGIQNMDPNILKVASSRISDQLFRSLCEEQDMTPKIRPSFGLTCPAQAYFVRTGASRTPMPPTIKATFVMGHFAHELCYATLLSALPKEINLDEELEVDTGFPDDCNQRGTCDFVISKEGDTTHEWVDESAPKYILGDFKTQTGFSFRSHKKSDFTSQGVDAWGYIAQLAVYANSPSMQEKYPKIEESGALLVGVNKESPQMGIAPRLISPKVLAEAKKRLDIVLGTTEYPGPWLMDTFGQKETAFYCGASGRKGYCGFVEECQKKRKKDTYKI